MKVSTSAYYDRAKQLKHADKIAENQKLRECGEALFDASKRSYGSLRLSDRLKKQDFPKKVSGFVDQCLSEIAAKVCCLCYWLFWLIRP
jgi:hypothetical protein